MELPLCLAMVALTLSLQLEVCAGPPVRTTQTERGQPLPPAPHPPRREKRCSCDNLKDKECVYFCHIGIVWVTTPSQVVPYGMGPFPLRRRRDLGRCLCMRTDDSKCLRFCSHVDLRQRDSVSEGASLEPRSPRKTKERYKVEPTSSVAQKT